MFAQSLQVRRSSVSWCPFARCRGYEVSSRMVKAGTRSSDPSLIEPGTSLPASLVSRTGQTDPHGCGLSSHHPHTVWGRTVENFLDEVKEIKQNLYYRTRLCIICETALNPSSSVTHLFIFFIMVYYECCLKSLPYVYVACINARLHIILLCDIFHKSLLNTQIVGSAVTVLFSILSSSIWGKNFH